MHKIAKCGEIYCSSFVWKVYNNRAMYIACHITQSPYKHFSVSSSFSFHPHERHSVWTLTIGMAFTLGMAGLSDQIAVQRYMAVKDTRAAQR